ncbi:hypothetical protein RM717_18935 [Streptomyces griseus]|uniref:Uncharacterized protein n=2 Tax=Streptomyces TaxID=1883 RepID=A0ABU2W621_9ACTN|nr:hypothetical protein [Streptomyces griseus]MDT0492582.1 hypothetical protein [Streptomyces griseus]
MSHIRALPRSLTAFAIAALLAVASVALLTVGGASASSVLPEAFPAGPTTTSGVSAYAAKKIVDAVNSPWAMALSVALLPLGLGGAALTIRATWATFVATIGKKAATGAMVGW